MKQEFVTLPRAVVEQAIAALTDLAGWRAAPLCDLLHAALEQPQVEQEPVAWLHQCNKRPDLIEMSFSKREPTLASKGYKARPLIFGDIAHPQPKREPLTVEQIAAATGAKPGTPTWPLAVAFTRAIEAAHNIK